jgi:nitrite reductase/ring-hydroxylating ferredoxin subunit
MKNLLRISIVFNIFVILFLLPSSCDENQQVVPNVYVDFTVMLSDPEYNSLLIPGNSLNVTGGVNGIIIYRISQDEFAAYDRTCTHDVTENCRVFVDETLVFAVDTACCGSKFLLLDGSAYEGTAVYPLKAYRTYFDGTFLRVYN